VGFLFFMGQRGLANSYQSSQINFHGIADLIQRFSATCWAVPTSPGFNPKDAQAKIVLGEIGGVQKAIYQKAGDDFITYAFQPNTLYIYTNFVPSFLRTIYFPSVGAPPEMPKTIWEPYKECRKKSSRATSG